MYYTETKGERNIILSPEYLFKCYSRKWNNRKWRFPNNLFSWKIPGVNYVSLIFCDGEWIKRDKILTETKKGKTRLECYIKIRDEQRIGVFWVQVNKHAF